MGQLTRNPCRQVGWFVMVAMFAALVVTGLMVPYPAPVPVESTPAIVVDERIDEVLAPGVRIRLSSGSSGSGVMIGEDLVLTAAHLFFREESKDATITVDLFSYDEHGEVVESDSVEACPLKVGDPEHDVALLRLRVKSRWAPSTAPLLLPGLSLRLFQDVYVVGCPKGLEPRITRGEISWIGEKWNARLVGANADIFFGNSGGALMVKVADRWYVATVLSRMEIAGSQALTFLAYYPQPDVVREFLASEKGGDTTKE